MKQMKAIVAGVLATASIEGTIMAQTQAPQSATSAAAPKGWVDAITMKGDIRYRHERIEDDSKLNSAKETYTRERDRIRARLGAEAKCNDQLKAVIEFSTGQSDPVSGNQSLGDGFSKKDFKLNLAYADYAFLGDNSQEIHALAGKMKNPFLTMPDDLVWDSDLTPEGLAFKTRFKQGPASLLLNGGRFWVQERADQSDLILYAGQAAVKVQLASDIDLTLGGSYYGFRNIQGRDVVDWENKNNAYGNSTVNGTLHGTTTNKAWATEFTPVTYFVQLDLPLGKLPLSLFAQGLSNVDADAFDAGHQFGGSLGKAKKPKSWELGYGYTKLEKDATVGAFTDSDRWGGGTDGQGHRVYGKYQLMKNLQAGVAYHINEKKISDPANTKDYTRLQLDLVASF